MKVLIRPAALVVISLVAALRLGAQAPAPTAPAAVLEPDFPVATVTLVDLDDDGRREMLVVGRAGEIRVHRLGADGKLAAREGWALPHPERSLLALARLEGPDSPLHLVVADPDGARAHAWSSEKGLAEEGRRLARRARFDIRGGRPVFADFVRDVNADGRADLVIPDARHVELWLATAEGFRRTAQVEVRTRISAEYEAEGNRDFLSQGIVVPDLEMMDVNGDGRPDLVVSRRESTGFHIQTADGAIPVAPDVTLELDRFRDTSEKATVRPGYTLAGTERAKSLIRDLDGDGIPDYLVAHRRKVWIFHGTKEGPQFTKPTEIMKTADEMTGIWLARLDDDEDVDLLIVRVQVPSIAGIIGGLLGSFEIDFTATGYANLDGKRFEKSPSWRRDLTFKLPSITEILRNPEAIIQRFEEAGRKFRRTLRGDFDGDGREDVGLVAEDGAKLEVFFARADDPPPAAETLDDVMREVFFEDDDDVWDLDRMVDWLGSLGARQAARLTAGRSADRSLALPTPAETPLRQALEADLDGRPGREIVLVYSRALREDADLARIEVHRITR
ncbi:MAG: VCBS repeat-containing protein [Planctomycetota bacterium]